MTRQQSPIGSNFNAASTAEDVIGTRNLKGKTAIVTGGYSGLGLETARVLAKAGVEVIVPARSPEKAYEALAPILPNAEVMRLDLMDPVSIDDFAQRFVQSNRPLHILINSAGVMATPLARDGRGNESQFSTNHLGHFQLGARLWRALRAANGARIVALSSRGHHIADIDFEDVNFDRRPYEKWKAYGQSKTANALYALAADNRGERDNVRAFSVHPGSVLGPLARHLTPKEIAAFGVHDAKGRAIVAPERDLKTASQGAATIVWCATSSQLDGHGGVYCEDCDIAKLSDLDATTRSGVKQWAVDPDRAERLWTMSAAITRTDCTD